MKTRFKSLLTLALFLVLSGLKAQQLDEIKLNPEKVKTFTPLVEWLHGGPQAFSEWKSNNKILYAKEMWYYTESFYIKRNHYQQGSTINDAMIDVSRLENQRKQDEEVYVQFPGFKDAVVLLPSSKLIYKP